MIKKKRGRPPKIKPARQQVEETIPNTDWPAETTLTRNPAQPPQPVCDCGNPAEPGSNQCWACSHRR